MRDDATGRTITAHEPRRIPWLDIVFGFGPMVPIAVGAAAAWWLNGQPLDYLVALFTLLYAPPRSCCSWPASTGRQQLPHRGGPRLAQIVTMLILYALGLFSLFSAVMGKAVPALAMLILGYAAIGILDPIRRPRRRGAVGPCPPAPAADAHRRGEPRGPALAQADRAVLRVLTSVPTRHRHRARSEATQRSARPPNVAFPWVASLRAR